MRWGDLFSSWVVVHELLLPRGDKPQPHEKGEGGVRSPVALTSTVLSEGGPAATTRLSAHPGSSLDVVQAGSPGKEGPQSSVHHVCDPRHRRGWDAASVLRAHLV